LPTNFETALTVGHFDLNQTQSFSARWFFLVGKNFAELAGIALAATLCFPVTDDEQKMKMTKAGD